MKTLNLFWNLFPSGSLGILHFFYPIVPVYLAHLFTRVKRQGKTGFYLLQFYNLCDLIPVWIQPIPALEGLILKEQELGFTKMHCKGGSHKMPSRAQTADTMKWNSLEVKLLGRELINCHIPELKGSLN